MVTGATYCKEKIFSEKNELEALQRLLFRLALQYGWYLEAWALFPNHYHFIAQSPENPGNLPVFIRHFHSASGIGINRYQEKLGRKVWYQYWDSQLTLQTSYMARLKYVMNNPVHHGVVPQAVLYPWCSARWFHETAHTSWRQTVERLNIQTVSVHDPF